MNEENKVNEEIVEWISKPENKELLDTLKLMKEASATGDWYESLSPDEKESIKRGIEDHQSGKTLTSEEFWNKHG
jgi:hypothetical protein